VTLSPGLWSLVQQVGRFLLAAIFYFAVVSFLAPADVGVLGIATVWIAFLGIFFDLGFGAAIVQRRQIEDRHLATVFFLNVGVGILLFMAGAALSWPLSAFMRVPAAQPVMLVLSAGFVINALSTVQAALAARNLRFRALALRDLVGVVAGGTLGVLLAWAGMGVWSLVAQSLATSLIGTVLLWKLSPYRPRFSDWSTTALKELWGFSSRLFGVTVFKYFVQNADVLQVGYFFGAVRLGLYSLATKAVTQPVGAIDAGVGSFLFSRAARLQDEPARLADLYTTAYKGLNYLVLPFVVAAGVWGGLVIPAVLGPEWQGTGLVFVYLAIMGVAHPPMTPVGQLMKALGKPDWFLWWSIAFSVVTNGALLVGAQFGFEAALAALAGSYVAMIPAALFLVHRLLPGALPRILRAVAPSYIPPISFALVLVGLRLWLGHQLSVAVLSTGVGALLYLVLVHRSDPGFTALVRRQVVRVRPA
jgi:polysaccharide transporter, PST family